MKTVNQRTTGKTQNKKITLAKIRKGKMTIKDPEYTTQKTKTTNNTNSIENMG
jgi:hypothetical protein